MARRFGISQSTVSRFCAKVLRSFNLTTARRHGEWELLGDPTHLNLERTVHQQARRLSHRPLRLEATSWSAPVIAPGLPAAWLPGRSNIVGVRRTMQLVQDRVVDGWLAGLPDRPDGDHPTLTAIVLSRRPVFFTCAAGHPHLNRPSITVDDSEIEMVKG
jgi:hypothetical protein